MIDITLRTRAWMDESERAFAFPEGWEITMYRLRGGNALDDAGIENALANPIGTDSLSQMARGKTSAVIIVDDLSRPTPAWRVVPFVLAQLREAGVPDSGIRFVVGGGAHRPLSEDEIAKKVGKDVAAKYPVFNHDAYSGRLTGMGNLEDGTPVFLNPVVADSALKIGLAGIYPHPSAGLGGGAKIVVPGVVGIATIAYNHGLFRARGRGNLERQGFDDDMRDNAENVARFIGLDMIINTVLNGRRDIAGLFVGDVMQAHRAGMAFAKQVYSTPIPERDVAGTDIVFINAYPLDYDPVQVGKSTWAVGLFKNAYKVMINAASDGILYHGLSDHMDYVRHVKLKDKAPKVDIPSEAVIKSKEHMAMFSEGFRPEDYYRRNPDGALFSSWDALIAKLKRMCPTGKVAIIPCSSIQLPRRIP